MRKPLIIAISFVVSMVLGVVLLQIVVTAVGFVQMAMQQSNHSGIGAVAGGISEVSVLLVPLLFGVIGTLSSPCAESNAKNHEKRPTVATPQRGYLWPESWAARAAP
jgi:hypothetical protein